MNIIKTYDIDTNSRKHNQYTPIVKKKKKKEKKDDKKKEKKGKLDIEI